MRHDRNRSRTIEEEKRSSKMMNHSFSMLSFLLMMTVTILFEGALSVEARTMNRSDSLNSDFIEGNEHRRKSRGLATSTMSKDTVSDTDADDESTLTATDKKLPSAKKGSIASRTGSVVTTKETSFSDPESMGIHFVKPETVAPSVAPNPMTTSSPSIAPNSTSTSSSAPTTKKRTSPPVPARTSYPTAKNVESIASRSSTMEVSTRTPLSSNMEFDMAKIVSPSTLRPTSSTTSASSVDSDTVEEAGDEVNTSSNINIDFDESLSISSRKNSTLVFPTEKDQPEQWPFIVCGIFVFVAIGFFGVTAFKNHQKRRDYQEVPMSLTV